MPPKRTASPSTSSRRARERKGKKDRDKLAIATQLLAEFRLRLRTHDIPYFSGTCRVQVRGPTNTPFVTLLRSLLQINYVPRQIVYPTHHFLHNCRFCPHLQKNLTRLMNIKLYNQTSYKPRRRTPQIASTAVKSSSTTAGGAIRLELTTRRVNTLRATTCQCQPTNLCHRITCEGPSVHHFARWVSQISPLKPQRTERGNMQPYIGLLVYRRRRK